MTRLPPDPETGRLTPVRTSGIIVETEAYCGPEDRASHAYAGRRTARTEIMYADGGVAYVFLCYGMHHLFNVVTNRSGTPHAILIRAVEPDEGIPHMLHRRGHTRLTPRLAAGPGAMTRALGICGTHNGISLAGTQIWITGGPADIPTRAISARPRIGVDYAGRDARRPWRFILRGSPWISRP